MIERKEQPPARNRESRQTTTTAESGGGGLVSVFAPPYGEDAPPAFHRYENAKTWTRGAFHRYEKGKTWTRERGAKPQRRPPYGRSGARVLPAPCVVSTTRPKVAAAPAFSFGRVLDELAKYRNSTDYAEIKRHLPPFSGVFGVFLAAFWPYSGKEPKNAAEQQKQPAASANSQTRNAPRCFCCGDTRGGAFVYLLVAFFQPKGKPNVHHLVTNTLPNKANRIGQSAPRGLSRRKKRAAAPQRNDRKPTKR